MPHNWSPSDVVMIITAIFGGLCSLVAAIKATKADNKATAAAKKSDLVAEKAVVVAETADENNRKLDEIHVLTNGNLTKTREELEMERRKTDYLENLIIELSADCSPGQLEKSRKKVEEKLARIGKRRKTDLARMGDSK